MKKIFGRAKKKDANENGVDQEDQEEMEELAASNDFKGIKLARSPDSGLSDRTSTGDQVSMISSFDRKGGRQSSRGRTELHKAARNGVLDEVQSQLNSGARTTAVDDEGCTPLHDAAACNADAAEKIMEMLLNKSDQTCVNRRNVSGLTALHIAASGGRDKLVRALLEHGARIDECDNHNKNTALHLAAACPDRNQSVAVVSVICERNDDHINKLNAAGRTALHLAAGIGNAETVKILLKYGARRTIKDEDGFTAVHVAAACEDEAAAAEIIRELCVDKKAAKSTEKSSKSKQSGTSRSQRRRSKRFSIGANGDDDGYCEGNSSDEDDDENDLINWRSFTGKSALHVAAGVGRSETVKTLLKYGARRSILDSKGRTPLHHLALKFRDDTPEAQKAIISIVQQLSRASWSDDNDDVDFVKNQDKVEYDVDFVNRRDKAGQTALHLAAQLGQQKIIKALLDCKASVSEPHDAKGYTPIMAAAFSKETVQLAEILALLCSSAKSPNTINEKSLKSKWTALHAAAYNGQTNAVKTLIENGATLTLKNKDENTPLHIALLARDTSKAAEILKAMIDSTRDDKTKMLLVSEKGDKKKTLLHLAANKGLFDVVAILLGAGAKLDVVDEDKWTPLHEACAAAEDDTLSSANIVRKFCEISSNDPEFLDRQNSHGETALHMAARFGHLQAAKILLNCGARFDIRDNDGWLALHSSVSGGEPQIARAIVEAIKTSREKQQQMRMAGLQANQKRSFKSVGKLVAKQSASGLLDVGSVTKHMMIVKNISKLLNEKDNCGRSALHLAADMNSADMIRELKDLDPEAKDNNAVTPLHVAVSKPNSSGLKAVLDVFYGADRSKSTDVDHPNSSGNSVLHVCCEEGEVNKVRLLLASGASLERRGRGGYTILHRLVKVFSKEELLRQRIIDVYHEIVSHAVAWKCRIDRRVAPKPDSEVYNGLLRDTMRRLICCLPLKGLNVLQYAAKKSATQLLKEILTTPYVFNNPLLETFEVTYLFPDTVPEGLTSSSGSDGGGEDDVDGRHRRPSGGKQTTKPLSCLELIVNSKDLEEAEEVLGLYPFNELMQGYWIWCRRAYNFLLLAHVLFMSLFTAYVMPTSDFIRRRFNLTYVPLGPNDVLSVEADAEAEQYRIDTMSLYGLFLIWPAIIIVKEIVGGLEYAYRTYKDWVKSQQKIRKGKRKLQQDGEDDDDNVGCKCTWRQLKHNVSQMFQIGKLLLRGFEYMSHIAALAFCASVLAWYIMYIYGSSHHSYCECLAAVFIFGWMHTISYVKTFKQWHAFALTFKHIVAKDVVKFAYIFVFVLISFSFAIHALSMSLYPPVHMHSRTLAETIYLTFCLTVTVTVGGLLDISTEPDYERAGGNIQLLHIVFAGYICTSTIILLNMLIAMMNSTYSAISSQRATAWRIESLRTALWIERTLPCISRSMFVRFEVMKNHEFGDPRWFIKFQPEEVLATSDTHETEEDEVNKTITYLQDLRTQLTQLQHDFSRSNDAETSKSVTDLRSQLENIQEEQRRTRQQMEAMMLKLQDLCENVAASGIVKTS